MEPRVCTVLAEHPRIPQERLHDGPQRSSLFASWVHNSGVAIFGKCRLVPSGRVQGCSAVTACPAGDSPSAWFVCTVLAWQTDVSRRLSVLPGAIGSSSSSPMIVVGLVIGSCCPSASALRPPMLVVWT